MLKTMLLPQLKVRREEKRWTQEMLAEFSGVSVRTIQRLESGMGASLETAKAITAAMALSTVDDLQNQLTFKVSPQFHTSQPPLQAEKNEQVENLMAGLTALYGGALLLTFVLCILSTTDVWVWLAKAIGLAGVVGAATGVIVKLNGANPVRVREYIKQSVIVTLSVLFFYALCKVYIGMMEERQWLVKRGEVLDATWSAINDSMAQAELRMNTEQDFYLDDFYSAPMSAIIGQDRWSLLVSNAQKIALPTCPSIRMDMTHAQVADWAMQIKTKCTFSHPK